MCSLQAPSSCKERSQEAAGIQMEGSWAPLSLQHPLGYTLCFEEPCKGFWGGEAEPLGTAISKGQPREDTQGRVAGQGRDPDLILSLLAAKAKREMIDLYQC